MSLDTPVAAGARSHSIRVLLTVPHLHTASPFREMMAIATLLPRHEFDLTVCSLRRTGLTETAPRLASLGVPLVVAAFRPKQHTIRGVLKSLQEQALVSHLGPFDIQHSLDFTSSPFEAAVARWHGRKFVFSQRNMNEGGHTGAFRLKIRLATHAVAISSGTRHLLEQHGAAAARVTTIYNGIDLDSVPFHSWETRRDGREVVLCVGQIVPRKRQADAVRAFAILAADRPAAILRIVGPVFDHSYHQALVALSAELNVSDRVEFLGERQDAIELMRHANALILCSESEGVPWVILEAMAVGLPVIVSDIAGPSEIIAHPGAGFLVPVGDIDGYAHALRRVLDDKVEAALIAAKARALVEQRFQARTMVAQLASLYRTLALSAPDYGPITPTSG